MDDLMASLNKANEEAEKALGGQPANTQQNTGYSGAQQSGYGNTQTGYGNSQQSGYGNTQTSYGSSQQSGYGNTQTGYGSSQQSGYGNTQTSYGSSQQSGYGNTQTGYGSSQQSGYGNTQTSYGSSQQSGYGNTQTSYGSSQQSGSYGMANRSYNSSPSTGYDSADTVSTTSYDSFGSYSSESEFTTILKGALGALVGAIPGLILMILISRLGFIAALSGFVMAAGIVFGYGLMTKNSLIDTKIGVIICVAVMIVGVYVGVRISWSWKLSIVLQESLSLVRSTLMTEGDSTLSSSELDTYIKAFFGVSEGSFGECFSNFSRLVSTLGLKGKYVLSLVENYAFAFLGGAALFTKFGKN